jgi:thiamine-phosphate pyrophosphorylase
MTDERIGDGLWRALLRMPPGSGVIFRHHATPPVERRAVFVRVRRIARARRLVLLAANPPLPGAEGLHGRVRGATSWPTHDRREAAAGLRAQAALLLVSPVFATRSHPGTRSLGPMKAVRIGRGGAIVALGGMSERRWRRFRRLGFVGWAGIDAWEAPCDP